MDDQSSLSLFVLFVEHFEVARIYEVGWMAAREWMAVVTGVLLAIAIGIRSLEEKVNLLSGGQSGYMKMVVNIFILTCAIGLYFTIAQLIISFFNALYSVLENSTVVQMGEKLDSVIDKLKEKEHEFSWSEVGDAVFSAFALIAYWLTHMVLVFVTVAMRIAHALLVSWCLFYGAVALPMSITTGLKMLTPLRNLALMVLLWPLVESFFMFAISASFTMMLDSSYLNLDNFTTWNMGVLVFYLTAFAIINVLLAASLIAAPYVAQGLANGSGNVTGVIGSFAGAGIAAGVIAAKSFIPKPVAEGAKNSILGAFGSMGSAAAKKMGGETIRKIANTEIAKGMSPAGGGGRESYQRNNTTKNNLTNKNTTSNNNIEKNSTSNSSNSNTNNSLDNQKQKVPLANSLEKQGGESGNSSETPELENNSSAHKKNRSGKAGYFANKAIKAKTPPLDGKPPTDKK
jgi:hypothetical protein